MGYDWISNFIYNGFMITNILQYIAGTFVATVNSTFGIFNYFIPDEFSNSILYFLSYLRYLNIIFPVDTLMACIGTFISFLMSWYGIKLILWIASFFRSSIGKGVPKLEKKVIGR